MAKVFTFDGTMVVSAVINPRRLFSYVSSQLQ